MLQSPIDQIDEAMLLALVANEVAERRDLEFKRDLPGGGADDSKEFLADVTSLANAQGGDLIFGIEDRDGVAGALPGLDVADIDGTVLALESKIRDGVEPRLSGVRTRWVALASGRGALVIRVPASLASPHRVRSSRRFLNRTSRGKYDMDVHELRQAFTESEQLPHRFRELHERAVAAAQGINMPFKVQGDPTAVVTVSPLGLFREQRDLAIVPELALAPVKPTEMSWHFMIEGVLVHTPEDANGRVRSYALTHHVGRTDAAWTIGGKREFRQGEIVSYVWPDSFEAGLLDMTGSTQAKLRAFGVEGPWVVSATVFGTSGFQLVLGNHYTSKSAWRDGATFSPLVVERFDAASLLPIFKGFWLTFGERRPENRVIAAP